MCTCMSMRTRWGRIRTDTFRSHLSISFWSNLGVGSKISILEILEYSSVYAPPLQFKTAGSPATQGNLTPALTLNQKEMLR